LHNTKILDSLQATKAPAYEINSFFSKNFPEEVSKLRPPLSLLIDHIDYIVKLVGAVRGWVPILMGLNLRPWDWMACRIFLK
jgi:membrane dipeptidase